MSKVLAHRHVTWAKHTLLGGLIASCCAALGCSARATGDADVIAISHEKPASARRRKAVRNDPEQTAAGDTSAIRDAAAGSAHAAVAGNGGSAGAANVADAGSNAPDSASPDVPGGALADPALGDARDVPRETVLFWVDAVGSRIWRANAEGDGSDRRLLAGALSIAAPDGITVDLTEGFVYWTNMGTPVGGAGVGSLQRMKLEDEVIETVIPVGTTSTPKQLNIDNQARQLYWSDREAMVWRSELDGSRPEMILSGHELMQPVGMGLDVAKRQLYITDRAAGRLYRVGFDMPEGETAGTRSDVETLLTFPAPAMPLNIALDLGQRQLYWTDRLRGIVYRMNMDMPAGATAENRTDVEVVVDGLTEPVGIAFDDATKRLYFSELSGRLSRCNLDGSAQKIVLTTASASGIALAHLPL